MDITSTEQTDGHHDVPGSSQANDVDVLDAKGTSTLKRLVPVMLGAAMLVVVRSVLRARR